jgi:multimeric flavodoxin WrbA
MKRALIVYWSATGNTEKVAFAIRDGLRDAGVEVTIVKTKGDEELDYFEYDLVCVGFPAYMFHPPEVMVKFLKGMFTKYEKEHRILWSSPTVTGKHALIFCTYSGPHSGIDEATPAGKYAGQFFVHVGIPVIDEWYVVGEFHGRIDASTVGKLGDIRGKPTAEELAKIRSDATKLATKI